MDIEIKPGLKISLNGDNGVVIDSETEGYGSYGMIRWDTVNEDDLEDFRGIFGTLFDMGGIVLDEDFEFNHIRDDGSIKL